MKCKNCGHANQENAMKCTECNAPFNGSMILGHLNADINKAENICKNCGTSNDANHIKCLSCNAPLTGTNILGQIENSRSTSIKPKESETCVECGYPNLMGSSACAACQKPLNTKQVQEQAVKQPLVQDQSIDPSMTINPWVLEPKVEETGFSLVPLVKGELMEEQKIEFKESEVALNRGNLDPKNTTITNQKQATIKQGAEGWMIENNSQLGTTFIQVSEQKNLQEGDVILMGNMLYQFKANS